MPWQALYPGHQRYSYYFKVFSFRKTFTRLIVCAQKKEVNPKVQGDFDPAPKPCPQRNVRPDFSAPGMASEYGVDCDGQNVLRHTRVFDMA